MLTLVTLQLGPLVNYVSVRLRRPLGFRVCVCVCACACTCACACVCGFVWFCTSPCFAPSVLLPLRFFEGATLSACACRRWLCVCDEPACTSQFVVSVNTVLHGAPCYIACVQLRLLLFTVFTVDPLPLFGFHTWLGHLTPLRCYLLTHAD